MSSQIADLSQRLQSALDQNYNVADMETVLHVISTLENIQITKEQLETTRLGKYINHLRRKTTNESLARRAKSLLRKWREMVFIPQQQQQQQHQSELITSTTRSIHPPINSSYAFQSTNKDLSLPSTYGITDFISHENNTSNTSSISANQNNSSNHLEGFQQLNKGRNEYDKSVDAFSNLNDMNKVSSRDIELYRTSSLMNDNSRSPISISSLPKIPKIKNSSSQLRSNKNVDRSHSPLVNLTETSPLSKGFQRNTSTYMHDDNSRHSHDHDTKLVSMINGRDAYNVNSSVWDNSSNSSTIHSYDKERGTITLNINQPNECLNSDTKKKHKKHKKDKKSKKQKHQLTSAHLDRSLVSRNDSSTLLFNEKQSKQNVNEFTDSFDVLKTSVPPPITKQSIDNFKYDDLSFTGKFGADKKNDLSIIHIDSSSSSCSNSPKIGQLNVTQTKNPSSMHLVASRSSSPTKMKVLLSKTTDMGYNRAVIDDETSNRNILRHTPRSVANLPAESLSQDISMVNINNENSSVQVNPNESEIIVKKRGRKKGSKGVDSRLANTSNSSQSQQGNSQYYDPISFTSLKNQIDLIRGTTKKVKTTKELLAELQNRKPLTYNDHDVNLIETPQPESIFDDELNDNLGDDLDEIRATTPIQQTTSIKQSKKSKSSSKRRHSGDSIVEKEVKEKNIEPKNTIDDEIQSLQSQLPLVNKVDLIKWKKLIQNEKIVCTCELIEYEDENEGAGLALASSGSDLIMKNQLSENSENNFIIPNVPTEDIALTKDSISSTSCIILGDQQPILQQPQPMKKVIIKSIFDFDYEEDDDPLNQINHNNNDTSLIMNNYNISSKSDSILNNNHKDNSNNEISNDKNKQICDEVKSDSERITNPMLGCVPLKSDGSLTKNITFQSMAGQKEGNDNGLSIVPNMYTQELDRINASSLAELNTDPNNLHTQPDLNETPPQKRFRIEEDPACKAKEYYVTSKQLITKFHVEKLHNAFVSNVNGNWDNAVAKNELTIIKELSETNDIIIINDSDEKTKSNSDDRTETDENSLNVIHDLGPHITEQSIGLYERVVPLCNHLIMDRLPKNLSDIKMNVIESDEIELDIFISKLKSEVFVNKTDSFESESVPNVSDGKNIVNVDIGNQCWELEQDSKVFAYKMEIIRCTAFESSHQKRVNDIQLDINGASDSNIIAVSHAAMDIDGTSEQGPSLHNSIEEENENNLDKNNQSYGEETDDNYDDDIDPMLVCASELNEGKESSGVEDSSNSDQGRSDLCTTKATDCTSHDDGYLFKSRNGDFSNKSPLHMQSRTNSPSTILSLSSSSGSSQHYNESRYSTITDQINPEHVSSSFAPIKFAKDIILNEQAGNRTSFKGILSNPVDVNSAPTESETSILINIPPVVEIHQQNSQPKEVDEIRNVDIPSGCMLPKKILSNEDSTNSDEKNEMEHLESKQENTSSSIAENFEQNMDPLNEQNVHIDDEKVMPEIHHSASIDPLPTSNNERLLSFNNLSIENESGSRQNGEKFREWYEVVHIKSYNDELLTILPYVVID